MKNLNTLLGYIMTLNEVYLQGKHVLKNAKINSYAFDAMRIFEFCFNFDRQDIILYRNSVADTNKTSKFFKLIQQRACGRPLQYILGCWSFMDAKIKVGEGVLIPRDDTEVLVNTALFHLNGKKNPTILDLCAGPGTISINLALKLPHAKIVAVELSQIALEYLDANINLNNVKNVIPVQADVLSDTTNFKFKNFDLIISNPPYIPTCDIKNLQKEVLHEPQMALDGGDDGLKFYHSIAKNWCSLLKNQGCICVEVGIGQANSVAEIFLNTNLKNVEFIKDFNNIDRVVVAKKL